MVSFSEAVQESGRLALCALFAGNEAVNALLSPLTGDSLGLYPLTSGLRRKLCSDDPGNDPVYEPLFEGGQCPTLYNVGISYTFVSGFCGNDIPATEVFQNSVQGPISVVTNNSTTPDPGGICDGYSYTTIQLLNASGSVVAQRGSGLGIRLNGITPVRSDAGVDNCGDPPPPPGVPGPITYEGDDITYNIDESTDITVPISFVFSPAYVDLDGSINVPVNFDVGGVEFNGTVEVSPEFNFEFNPGGISTGPGTVDDPDGIGEPGEPSDPVDDPEEGTLPIIGVLVYSDIDPDGDPSGILFQNGPNIYVPRLASVQFLIKTADSTGWTPDQDVKNLECYVPCPALQGAIAVRVSPVRGVTSRFSPVRGRLLTPDT